MTDEGLEEWSKQIESEKHQADTVEYQLDTLDINN